GNTARRLARAQRLRGAGVAALLALSDRNQPKSQRDSRTRAPPRHGEHHETVKNSPRRRASWLEPYADSALPDPAPGPEARYEQREAIQLSFIVALQQLPAKQRAALVLRDVLGFHTDEAASILETTPQSVKAALQRARATLD